jgi:hypothetical protein
MKTVIALSLTLLLSSCIIIPGGWHEHGHHRDRDFSDGWHHERR